MKICELCSHLARVFCDSDQASLCWDCDGKVHGANFLVAKHSRSLLCHVCQAPTAWNASGPKFGPTVSVCESCVKNCDGESEKLTEEGQENQGRDQETEDYDEYDDSLEIGSDEEDDEDVGEDDDEDEDNDEEGENQVVPWSSGPPPPTEYDVNDEDLSSSVNSFERRAIVFSQKRKLQEAEMDSEGNSGCTSLKSYSTASMATGYQALRSDETTSSSSFRPVKMLRKNAQVIQLDCGEEDSRTAETIASLKKFQQHDLISSKNDASEVIFGICRMNKDS